MPLCKDKNFTVVDISGVHKLHVTFCGCIGHPPYHIQLLRDSWFPASLEHPETAFSFELLNFFQILNHHGKVSAYDFYSAVHNICDNTGLANLPVIKLLSRGFEYVLT